MKTILKFMLSFILIISPILGDSPETTVFVDDPFRAALSTLPQQSSGDIRAFYEKRGNEPVWFFQGNLSKCGQIAVQVLQDAALEGLNPEDYQDAAQIPTGPTNWIEAELLLTKRFLEYINHVRIGRIDPQKITREIKFHRPKIDPAELLAEAFQDPSTLCEKLRHMAPDLPKYASLKATLAHYRQLAKETPEWPRLENLRALKLGDDDPQVNTLREILYLFGDSKNEDFTSTKFDRDLDQALRQFQTRHTLESDGVVGGKTKEALNEPIEGIIRKILINMERIRWLPENLGKRYIIVNVAGYEVNAYDNNELQLTIPAIIGRPSRRTPLFYAKLKNVIINPSWGVPYSIFVHDKLPKILNDPDYVRRSGFTVTDSSGSVIDPDEADWESEGSSYRLRQSPGRHNALGRVKFNIENPYTIYLHGTPEEKLFLKTARPFSSGCVRLKFPIELAEWILDDKTKWSEENIKKAINKGSTQSVIPEETIGVYFTYQTIWQDADGLIHFSNDPYNMDPKMEKVLHPDLYPDIS